MLGQGVIPADGVESGELNRERVEAEPEQVSHTCTVLQGKQAQETAGLPGQAGPGAVTVCMDQMQNKESKTELTLERG